MSQAETPQPDAALLRDLAMVLGSPDAANTPLSAFIAGREASIDDAAAAAVKLLALAVSPGLVGLRGLSIEGVRAAVALARRTGAKLLPWPAPDSESSTRLVTQTASLGNAFASDLILWIGCRGTDTPITRAIAENQLLAAFLQADLPTVLGLRGLLKNTSETSPFGTARRITAVIADNADARVVSQWHKLANQVQQRHRIAVLQLPAPSACNTRGMHEAITWLSGIAPTRGGVDMAALPPAPCGDARDLLSAGTLDVVLDLCNGESLPHPLNKNIQRITIGATHDPSAAVSFALPPLSPGTAARVMRFDGVTLWLCDDPTTGRPDHAADLLRRLHQSLELPAN